MVEYRRYENREAPAPSRIWGEDLDNEALEQMKSACVICSGLCKIRAGGDSVWNRQHASAHQQIQSLGEGLSGDTAVGAFLIDMVNSFVIKFYMSPPFFG